ncbi:MAG: Cob(I)yrinic acid a,c-diamide adenosyltransferase [candidate division WS2 bacterium ADurb.Bin280]|uniref:Cob(I)yrinic acid a,c-diamide adenosyltransferase n=1 Tax=candidate division WS2 bacterium ADurb.Bin280 TaxID=1852829 RepID=A0A1V5SF94_9BACT|nr:MAG: Cob(I)yrinic acid a,c-diamide adenosyltransferase [candidate division WS2 bacterium ADurb.Bin280]
MKKDGLIIAYIGEGKGKSTAAFGLALRAIGQEKKVCIIQFIKSNEQTGEAKFFKKLKNECEFIALGEGFVSIQGDTKTFKVHKNAAQKAIEVAEEIITSNKYEVIILDEIVVAMALKLITQAQIKKLLLLKKDHQTIVITGRGELGKIEKLCDLITQMKCIAHPFDQKVEAIRGIDY